MCIPGHLQKKKRCAQRHKNALNTERERKERRRLTRDLNLATCTRESRKGIHEDKRLPFTKKGIKEVNTMSFTLNHKGVF